MDTIFFRCVVTSEAPTFVHFGVFAYLKPSHIVYYTSNAQMNEFVALLNSCSSEVRVISCPAEVTMCVGLLLFIATIAVDKKRMRCEKVTTKGQVINNLNIVLFQAALDLLLHWKWGFSPAQKRNQRD